MIAVAGNNRIGAAVVERVIAIYVEIVVLVEAGAADIHAKFEAMVAFYPAQAVGPLEAVTDLRKYPLPIVAKLRASRNGDVRNSGQV